MKPLTWYGTICAILAAAGLGVTGSPGPACAANVDLQLLLAVDVSFSVDPEEYALQIHGLAAAMRSPEVIDAIATSAPNGVAVALMQWAGPREQTLSVPWSEVRDRASAEAFAASVETVKRPGTNGGTAIGDALAQGIAHLADSRFRGTRQVIDVSGDGKTNRGDSPAPVRRRATASGITINGLVILNEEPHLGDYYVLRVVGGPGAFVLHAQTFDDFAHAIRMKLIREIEVSMATVPPGFVE
jgi:hypothetical protein